MTTDHKSAGAGVMTEETACADHRALAEFRYKLRRYLAWMETSARNAGLEPQQHQLMLTVAGLPVGQAATVGVLAERLQVRHHTAVELVDRLQAKGLVLRRRSTADHRAVIISLTPEGVQRLSPLVRESLATLRRVGPDLIDALREVVAHESRG